MIGPARILTNRLIKPMTITRGYKGGVPGNNLPWKMDSPMYFSVWWLFWGVIGFGAPWLVIRHQMLRKDGLAKIVYIYEVNLKEESEK